VLVGQVGYVAKGLAFVIIGVLVCWAAVTDNPRKAGGLDQSLARLVQVPMGAVAVIAIGVGIACFGLYLFARARHLAPRTLTS
jgi:type IV secretory pathway VirB2 component (pilin)